MKDIIRYALLLIIIQITCSCISTRQNTSGNLSENTSCIIREDGITIEYEVRDFVNINNNIEKKFLFYCLY